MTAAATIKRAADKKSQHNGTVYGQATRRENKTLSPRADVRWLAVLGNTLLLTLVLQGFADATTARTSNNAIRRYS